MKTLKIITGGILYSLSGGRIITKTAKEYISRQKSQWAEKVRRIQAELDEEHESGRAIRYIDGAEIRFRPFSSNTGKAIL